MEAITAGTQVVYGAGSQPDKIVAALTAAVQEGELAAAAVDALVKRVLLYRFRLGEFDTHNPANPFRSPVPPSFLNSAANRALARDAAGRSVVLLENSGGLLPLASSSVGSIAVVGPFADCTTRLGGYGKPGPDCSYLHSYSGTTDHVSTVRDAVVAALGSDASVTYSPGCNATVARSPSGIADAVKAASASNVTLLVLGLGAGVEAEGRDRVNLTLPDIQA